MNGDSNHGPDGGDRVDGDETMTKRDANTSSGGTAREQPDRHD